MNLLLRLERFISVFIIFGVHNNASNVKSSGRSVKDTSAERINEIHDLLIYDEKTKVHEIRNTVNILMPQ